MDTPQAPATAPAVDWDALWKRTYQSTSVLDAVRTVTAITCADGRPRAFCDLKIQLRAPGSVSFSA